MKRRQRHFGFHEPSLVPLADMLTNTFGVLLFILVFTVLATGGMVVAKRLPLEHGTNAESIDFLCAGGRLLFCDEALLKKFVEPIEKTVTQYNINDWTSKFNGHKVEGEDFLLTGEASGSSFFLSAAVIYVPRPGKGENGVQLRASDSHFRHILKEYQGKNRFVYFIVRPDSIGVFMDARALATDEYNYQSGWRPTDSNGTLRVSVAGGGYKPGVQ